MRKTLHNPSSGETGNILRKFLFLFMISLIVISLILIGLFGIRSLYFNFSGTSTIQLSGQVFQVTDRGNLALQDATVSIMHEGERIVDTTNSLGKFHITYETQKRGKKRERIVVNYPQYETIGKEIEINYTDGTIIDSMIFQIGSLASSNEEVYKVRNEIHKTHLDFTAQGKSLINTTDSLKLIENISTTTDILDRLISQHQLNTRFLMDDSLLFALNEISTDRMKQELKTYRKKQQKILEVKDSLLSKLSN